MSKVFKKYSSIKSKYKTLVNVSKYKRARITNNLTYRLTITNNYIYSGSTHPFFIYHPSLEKTRLSNYN